MDAVGHTDLGCLSFGEFGRRILSYYYVRGDAVGLNRPP